MKPLKKTEIDINNPDKVIYQQLLPNEEYWENEKYFVCVRRGLNMGSETKYKVTHLSIRHQDRNNYLIDWREFQQIKNQLVGHKKWGFEIYPSEDHLVDGSNQFHIWVFESAEIQPPFGFFDGRMISETSFFGEVQRPFEDKPKDLKESEERIQDQVKKAREHFNNERFKH